MDEFKQTQLEHLGEARLCEQQRAWMSLVFVLIAAPLLVFASIPGVIALFFLGLCGLALSAKLYEQSRRHREIAEQLSYELKLAANDPGSVLRPLDEAIAAAEGKHAVKFRWPSFGSESSRQLTRATSLVGSIPMHVFWESVHLLIMLFGIIGAIYLMATTT